MKRITTPVIVLTLIAAAGCAQVESEVASVGPSATPATPDTPAVEAAPVVVELSDEVVGTAVANRRIVVEGMHCGGCANALEQTLASTAGVVECRVSFDNSDAIVTVDDAARDLPVVVAAITKMNYTATLEADPVDPNTIDAPTDSSTDETTDGTAETADS